MKSKNKKKAFIAVLSVLTIGASGAALAGCGKTVGYIDAPERLEEELGTYVIPEYEVVDNDGMILAGYNVQLKSVKNEAGEEVNNIIGSAVTIDSAGEYSFVYTAGSKKVKDVTVKIDFADRTAPTINYSDDLPAFFIKGNSYRMPSYTLSGDYDRTKCWAKVFHIAEDKTETEIAVVSNRFSVEHSSGSYAIRIHVEDAAGNANDYQYVRKVDGPAEVVEHKVLYLDEQFGERQVSCYQSAYTGGYVSKDTEGAHVYGDEHGAYKVAFDGVTATQYNEGLLVMDVPAIIDLTEYENIYLYVYNDSEKDIIMGSQWWNDTTVKAKQWTRLTWNTREWGYNTSANNTKQIGIIDISGMTIRFIFDYGQSVIPNGTFYLSAMYGTPKTKSEIELGEHVDITGGTHYINDVIDLNAEAIEGKTVDYYKVDGEIIPGTSFTITKTHHKVEVVYLDGEITSENMTWATPSVLDPVGGDTQTQYMGTDEYWAISYDFYGVEGWKYFGVYVGGNDQLLGFELSDATHSKLSGYGGAWKWMDGVTLSPEIYDLIRGATEDNPVKAVYVRRESEIRVFLISGEKTYFVGSVEFSAFGVTGNNFGYGTRYNADTDLRVTVRNFKAVAGVGKTSMFFEDSFEAQLTIDGTASKDKYYLGDKVELSIGTAPEGKLFAYFKVDGERIDGNTFYMTEDSMSVVTVYTDPSTVTLGEGIKTSDGKSGTITVAKETYISLDYYGDVPAGKYYIGFRVDGEEFIGNEIYITENTHAVEVIFGDKIQTGNDKLNDITETDKVIYALKDDNETVKWNPASVEHVTDFRFTGMDGAVDENSVLKITTGTDSGENSFAFGTGVDNLDAYQEIFFYAYTESSGVKGGGWWCADTELAPGKWTKVSFSRSVNPTDIIGNGTDSVWKAGTKKFAYRIFNAPAGITVYVTALYGVPYPDATVTKTDGVTVSEPKNGTSYKVNETVTLTAAAAPAGKKFAYFTVNGKKIEGNTYVLTDSVEFGAVYNDISALTLGAGVATSDGETEYAREVKVTLVYNGTPEGKKVFDYFTVDGERIPGNTFITSGATHTVAAVLADSVETLTPITGEEADKTPLTYSWMTYKFEGDVLGESEHWVINSTVTELENFVEGKDQWYGFDFLVGTNASIQIRIHTSGIFTVQAMGTSHDDGKDIGTYLIDANEVVAACKQVSADSSVLFSVIRDGDTYYVLFNGKLAVRSTFDFKATDNKFGVGATDCGWLPLYENETYLFRADEALTEYLTTAQITTTFAGTDKTSYKLGDTVVLTHDAADKGFGFSHYEVDGIKIAGDSFVITKSNHSVEAVYTDIKETYHIDVTLPENALISNGEFMLPTATVKDSEGSTIDGYEIKVTVTDEKGNACTVTDGKVAVGYTGAITLNVKYFCEELSGKDVTKSVLVQDVNGTVVTANALGASLVRAKEGGSTVEYSEEVKCDELGDSGSVKITVTQTNGNGDYAYLNFDYANFDYIELYAYTEDSGLKFGTFWYGDTDLTAGQWTKIRMGLCQQAIADYGMFILRVQSISAGGSVYISSVKLCKFESPVDSSTPIVDLSQGASKGEWTTEKFYTGDDITTSGSLKVTPDSGDYYGIGANADVKIWDVVDRYEYLYFYVYTDYTNPNSETPAKGSVEWAADTPLVAGEWTEVRITPSMFGNGGLWGTEHNMSNFKFRIINGNGADFYITSLYGKAKSIVEESDTGVSTTSYSLVNSGDDELAAIVNDNFFPDAE